MFLRPSVHGPKRAGLNVTRTKGRGTKRQGTSFETLGLRWAMLYRTSLPHLTIARTIWSEWTRSQWSPWLVVRCPLSAQLDPVISRLLSWYCLCNYGTDVLEVKQWHYQGFMWITFLGKHIMPSLAKIVLALIPSRICNYRFCNRPDSLTLYNTWRSHLNLLQ